MGIFRFLGTETSGGFSFVTFTDAINDPLQVIVIVMLALIALAAIIFAIWVGFRLARAEDEGKRKEAKQQLLWSIIAVIACVGMFVVLTAVLPDTYNFSNRFEKDDEDILNQTGYEVIAGVGGAIGALFSIISIGAMAFAIYIGIRLAMAPDEGKRKEAKQQLLWSLIALVGAIALYVIIGAVMELLIGQMEG